jgi:hypothetical protein
MDERLRQLIATVCQHPDGSLERRKAMHRLLIELQQLPRLLKSSHPDYLDALNRTWEWVNRNICSSFELRTPSIQESLVKWINGYLHWRIKDVLSPQGSKTLSLDKIIGDPEEGTPLLEQLSQTGLSTPTLSGLSGHIEQLERDNIQRIALDLERYIQQDPKGKLRNCFPRAHPNCNCHLLSIRRYLKDPPDSFSDIAQELNMKSTQLTNHWYGRCKPLLQEIAEDLGYRPNESP